MYKPTKMASSKLTSSCSKESTNSQNDERKTMKSTSKTEHKANLCPFKLSWSLGINSEVPLINLTTKIRTIIAYACSHIAIIYNYHTKEAINLQGHRNAIRTLSTSKDGKWLLSADFEEDCVIVVWDTETGMPTSTLFNPHGGKNMTAAKISPDAKYIVTVGNEIHQKVQFWLWTYGKDKPDATVELIEINSDRVKNITFNDDHSEEFALTADYNVAFLKWEQGELKYSIPQTLGNTRRYGVFNCSCYISKTKRVLTVTANEPRSLQLRSLHENRDRCVLAMGDRNDDHYMKTKDDRQYQRFTEFAMKACGDLVHCMNFDLSTDVGFAMKQIISEIFTMAIYGPHYTGYVLTWDVSVEKKYNKSQVIINSEEKNHIKTARLEKNSIMVILHHDGMVVTGTSEGRINFYDLNLKILYWCQHELLDSIRSISFDLSSMLQSPVPIVSQSEFEFNGEDDLEYEGEAEEYSETKFTSNICDEKIEYMRNIESVKNYNEVVFSTLTVNLEEPYRNHGKNRKTFTKPSHVPTDASIQNAPFHTGNFLVSCSSGTVALLEISALKCRFIFQNINVSITSLDAHPRSNYVITGNAQGYVHLYDYEKRKLIVRRKTPSLPDLSLLLNDQVRSGNIIYITCPQSHGKLIGVTLLKYSPIGKRVSFKNTKYYHIADLIACGLENGTLWMLHPITLEPLDENPYKHSSESILKLTFTECGEYMAYADNTFVVAVFKRNLDTSNGSHLWYFLGKYRIHYAMIRDILFGPATADTMTYRLFSLGEDQLLIEYDLKNSGPYPFPGLKIIRTHKIECEAIPLCLAWYPQLGIERFLMISNSEVLSNKEHKAGRYMVFATEKEIGLQILPFDGNPYKILGMIGHPRKVTNICVSHDGNILFTSGYNDPCVLIWKIKCRSVDVLAHLGGEGLASYYCLLEGGRKGWLINEMKDLFYYAQILHQGENTTAPRVISETVSTKEIPNLMRAVGYYPSNEEIEILMSEVSYRNYAETGHLVEEIKFEEFVKLYVNHRPAFGISTRQIQEAFQFFANLNQVSDLDEENPALTRDQFMRILFGDSPFGFTKQDGMPFGEPLTVQEVFTYIKLLLGFDEDSNETYSQQIEKKSVSMDFSFLPERISYKDFTADIIGIELPEETRADDE